MLQFCHFFACHPQPGSPAARLPHATRTHPFIAMPATRRAHAATRCYCYTLLHGGPRPLHSATRGLLHAATRLHAPTRCYTVRHACYTLPHPAQFTLLHVAAPRNLGLPPSPADSHPAPRRAAPPAPNRRLRPANSGLANSGPATPPPKPPLASPRAQGVGFLSASRLSTARWGP